jgi:hypothetical protein
LVELALDEIEMGLHWRMTPPFFDLPPWKPEVRVPE